MFGYEDNSPESIQDQIYKALCVAALELEKLARKNPHLNLEKPFVVQVGDIETFAGVRVNRLRKKNDKEDDE